MKKGLLFLLLCGSVFYAEASSLRPAGKKFAVEKPAWEAAYCYTENPKDRFRRVDLPEETSIGDHDHKTRSYTEDDRHKVDYTYHKDEYPREAEAPINPLDLYYGTLDVNGMKEEHEALNIRRFIGLEEDELLKQHDENFVFFRNINWKERELAFRGLEPREQVEQYKELLALGKIFKKFRNVVDDSEPDDSESDDDFVEYSNFTTLLSREDYVIGRLLRTYRRVVTDDIIQAVEQAAYEQAKAERAAAAAAKEAALAAELLSGLSLQKAPQDGDGVSDDGVSNDDNI